MSSVMLLVGTKKGAFVLQSDEARDKWEVSPPLCDHWPVSHVNYDPATKSILAAAGSEWFGHAIWRSNDMGATWTHSSAGLEYAEGEPPITAAWNVTPANGALYAGVNPAGLFKSTDGGESWSEMRGLRDAPGRDLWMEGGAGLILHTIVPHPSDPAKMYIAISAGGMYATEDGGETWEPRNRGIRASFMPEEQQKTAIAGFCCHRIVLSSGDPDFIFQQNHEGMYRSADAGHSWTEVSAGLPSDFGFATAAHPHQDKTFFIAPLTDPMNGRYMHNGEVAIWRTKDAGDTWERKTQGLPSSNAYLSVLRGAMDTDTLDQAGVYFGAANGTVYGSTDDGESWREIVTGLPGISSVEAVVLP